MYKATLELFRVHKSFKVKFSLIVKDDKPENFQKLTNKFHYLGNDYIKITPFPFITIDITSQMDKKEEWNSNRTVNLNRRELFLFTQKLARLYQTFVKEKKLFYFYGEEPNKVLQVNKTLAFEKREVVVCGNKMVLMQPCVVENEEDHILYEGMFLSINSMDYFSYLTYGEIEYLLYELKHIDMSGLSLQLINTVALNDQVESKNLKINAPPIKEKKSEEIVDAKPRIKIEEPSEIPEI